MSLPYNPFNPARTYRLFNSASESQQRGSIIHNNNNNNYQTLLIRNKENKGLKSDTNFNKYIKALRQRRNISKNLIQKHKDGVEMHDYDRRQIQSVANGEFKSHRMNKIANQITEMLNDIKNPNKKTKYLVNEEKDREKKLAKPLFFGIQNQAKSNIRKKQLYAKVDVNQLRQKLFFDDYNPFHLKTQSQYSQADSNLADQIKDFLLD